MMMRISQRTSQCQRSHCCLLVDHEHLLWLILEPLLRHLLMLCLLRFLLRHLFRLCLLHLLLMHLLKVLLLQLPRRPGSMTFSRSNPCSLCHTCSLRCQLPLALQRQPTEPETKKHKQQHEEDDEDLAMDSFHPSQPTDPPVLPFSEHQPAESRFRSRTHSEVSEAPTIHYPDPAPDPPRQSGQEGAPLPEPSLPPPDPPSRSSSVAPTEFYLRRHMDGCMLNWVTIRTSCSGRIWVSTILCSGWTTLKRRQPTTRST